MDYTWVNKTMMAEREAAKDADHEHGRRLDLVEKANVFKKIERDEARKTYTLVKTCVPSRERRVRREKRNKRLRSGRSKTRTRDDTARKPRTGKKGYKERHN